MIPPVGGIGAGSLSIASPATGVQGNGLAEPALGAGGSESGLGGVAPAGGLESAGGIESAAAAEPTSFGGELTKAISSLEETQKSAAGAAQGLAMGTAADPESAVVTVEDAQLAMQLASQIRTKATEAAQSLFQTQV
jgi:flagellar hook-basal body complex protein FliE